MKAVLDIIIIGMLIFCVAVGYKNGFVKTVMNFLSFIIAFIMAKTFSPALSDFICANWVKPGFVAGVINKIENILGNVSLNSMVKDPNRPADFTKILTGYGVETPEVSRWLGEATAKGVEEVEYVADNLVAQIAHNISYFLAFAAILLASLLLLKIAAALINRVVKLPGLNLINSAGGIVLGLIYGIILSYIFVFLADFILPYLIVKFDMEPATAIRNGTIFYKFFYEHPLLDFILGQG